MQIVNDLSLGKILDDSIRRLDTFGGSRYPPRGPTNKRILAAKVDRYPTRTPGAHELEWWPNSWGHISHGGGWMDCGVPSDPE